MSDRRDSLLEVLGLETGYGQRRIISGVDFSVESGEVVAVIGHNGAGKSTLLKALFGLLPIWKGSIRIDGEVLGSLRPVHLLRLGVAFVPQGNRVFGRLTVRDNLKLAALFGGMTAESSGYLERVFAVFPLLRNRLDQIAGTLSGGEKQMLAVGNALTVRPRLLLLDEPSLGLAPTLVSTLLDTIRSLASDTGVGVILVEQKVRQALERADRAVALRRGIISFSGSANELLSAPERLRAVYF